MKDNEIIKALVCCCRVDGCSCRDCPYDVVQCISEDGENKLLVDVYDLIDRQKAAIESLNNQYPLLICQLAEEREKAIKEFVKRFEKKIKDVKFTIGQTWEIQCALKQTLQKLSAEKALVNYESSKGGVEE